MVSIASHTRLWKSVLSGARGTLAGEGASPAKYPSSQATAASRACASASSHSAGARTTSQGIGRGQVERRARRGLVDAIGGTEEALPGHPQADERTAPRGQREAADGGVVGGERRIRTARGDLGRHTPTLSRRQSQRESKRHGRRSVLRPRSPPQGGGARPPQWAR